MKKIAASILALLAWGTSAFAADLRQQLEGYRSAHETAIVTALVQLTRMKSVAANPAGLTATADELERQLKARGFTTALLSAGGSPPAVFGNLKVPGAFRTVVFYAHYDGQPVTPSQWSSDPFAPVMRDGIGGKDGDWAHAATPFNPEWRLFGRAVADDKTSIISFLTAFDALRALGHKPTVNVKVLWEGEEEASSPHLADILKAHRAELSADLWLIGDGPVHQSRTPTLYFGARGLLGAEATVYRPLRALHDGHYGNWVPNPVVMAAEMITQIRSDEGQILIPGFSDDVRPLTVAENAAIARLPPVEAALKREFSIGRTEGTAGVTSSTMRPALNVRGIRSGGVGNEANNAIPIDAVVSMDFRLVPNETPDAVRRKVENFLKAKGWTVVTQTPDLAMRLTHRRIVKLVWHGGYPGFRSDMTNPAAKAVIQAANLGAGREVAILPTMGGSVPIYLFDDIFRVPVIGLPVVNHDDNQHAPDEEIRLKNLWDGIDTYAAMIGALSW